MDTRRELIKNLRIFSEASLREVIGDSLIKKAIKKIVRRKNEWSIGIYTGTSPCDFISPETIKNPVLTAQDVTDVPASFVADPFMIYENHCWYMFLEIMNTCTDRGEIGVATSFDGFKWQYQQVVLREPFHLSYPYLFKWQDDYYLIPETSQANSIRLYQATKFPTEWVFVKTLLDSKDYADPSIFYFNDKWWLFAATSEKRDILRLYHANEPTGFWVEHTESPIVEGNAHVARPGGRVIVSGDKLIRFAQDCEPTYGKQVRAFEITELTETSYKEKELREYPIIKASGKGWNADGMHTIDPHQIGEEKWIACVDGKITQLVFGLT